LLMQVRGERPRASDSSAKLVTCFRPRIIFAASLLGVFSALLNSIGKQANGFELLSLERPLGAAAAAERPLSSFGPVPQNKSETEIGSAARCRVYMQMKARSPPLHRTARLNGKRNNVTGPRLS
jgi:hypothetical protein